MLLAAVLFGAASCSQQQGPVEEAQEVNEQQAEGTPIEDQITEQSEFMTQAASSNMLEIEAGKLAQERGQMQEVKDYGQMMVKDHTNASNQLKQLAQQHNIVLPDSMSQDHQQQLQKLRDQKGKAFDQQYMDLMVNSHEETVKLFENASNNMQDTVIQNFATSTLPILRQHLDRARTLDQKIGQ